MVALPSSREYFEGISDAVGRFEAVSERMRMRRELASKPNATGISDGRHVVGWCSDETASTVVWLLEADRDDLLELVELRRQVADAVEVIDGVEAALGPKYADPLRLRYLRRMTWGSIGVTTGCAESTARLRANVALEYCDSVGLVGAKRGVEV